MIYHNKLIRDFIPEIIRASGKQCDVVVLDDARYRRELVLKLKEESREVAEAKTLNDLIAEIADVYEVLQAIQKAYNISSNDVACKQAKKALTNGKFENKYYLRSVDEGEHE